MTWASKRQTIILGAIVIAIIIILIPIVKPIVAPTATCFDGKKNGSELGVDCGGPCSKACSFEVSKVNILWALSFKVADGVYSAVTYVSNPNASFEAQNVPYTMKLYDDKNILVAERRSTIDIPAKSALPIFEGDIAVGKLIVKRVSFEFTGEPNWRRTDKGTPQIDISSPIVDNSGSAPKVTATIKNSTGNPIKNLPLVVIVYDENGNAMAASRTIVDFLAKNESTDASFTWLSPFSGTESRVEIYPEF